MKPINPVFPFFWTRCYVCGGIGHSLNMAVTEKPWTYICFNCQPHEVRETIRLNTLEQIRLCSIHNPSWVDQARQTLGDCWPRG